MTFAYLYLYKYGACKPLRASFLLHGAFWLCFDLGVVESLLEPLVWLGIGNLVRVDFWIGVEGKAVRT